MRYRDLSVEGIFFLCVLSLLCTYAITSYIDQERYIRKGTVEVTLEKIEPEKPLIKKTKIASLISVPQRVRLSNRELDCLSRNIYHEAKYESYVGKVAIAHVTFNRLTEGKWGDSFCKVIYARKQFSWTLIKEKVKEVPVGRRWEESKRAARDFSNGTRVAYLLDSDHYHADYIPTPQWAFSMEREIKIGKHIFYATRDFE